MFFTSMMPMMGMALNPMGSQMTGTDSGSTTDGGEGHNQEGSDIGGVGMKGMWSILVETLGDLIEGVSAIFDILSHLYFKL